MTTLTTSRLTHVHPDGPQGSQRLFAAGPQASLMQHLQAYGPLQLDTIGAGFIDTVEHAGLTGRGGAAFASWRKLAATRNGSLAPRSAKAVAIANGAEGEPLSFKDQTLLVHAPHLVIDGLLAVGRALNAAQLYIYANAGSLPSIEAAMRQRSDGGQIKLIQAPETFIAGEASAVVNSIGSGRAIPTDKRHRLSESGLKKHPTLVQNVETLAHMALIARYGAAWFRDAGTDADPGTRLLSISGHGAEEVYEVAGEASLTNLLATAAVEHSQVQAVLVGGYHGRWVRPLDYRISPQGSTQEFLRPGAGVIHILGREQCGLKTTAAIAQYLAGESAKQCGPCMFGLPSMAKTLSALAGGSPDPRLPSELARLAALVSGRGACHHPDGFVQLIGSALNTFSEDVQAHQCGRCTATSGRL